MLTRQSGTPQPFFGMVRAMAMPKGISMARMMPENSSCLRKASWKRSEWIRSRNQSKPTQKKTLLPKVSCTE